MTDRSHLPATIRARVHVGAIDRVTRFFDAGLAQAFTELIQNSRRSGATRVAVVTKVVSQDETSPAIRVTVTDDGNGIADPAVLLSFGESGWDQDTAQREDPAGMGVYALSKRGCTISSRARGPLLDLAPGWRVALTPECFLGKEDAAVVEGDAPWPHGTAISFIAHESLVAIESALAGAALYCPLPVTFNGEACKRKAFLDGAVHAERWRGLAFGVFRNRLTGFNDPDLICLTNNAAERALRGIALGRRSWLFAGSDRGGVRAAAMYTLIGTAKLNDVDPQAWLADVLGCIAGTPQSRLDQLLPWNWVPEQKLDRAA